MIQERKRKSKVNSQTVPIQLKPRMTVNLERSSVCAGDDMDPPHNGTLRVESVDDLAYQLKHYYLPRVDGWPIYTLAVALWCSAWISRLLVNSKCRCDSR